MTGEKPKHIEPQKNSEYWELANKILDAVYAARVEGIRDDIEAPYIRYHQVNFIIAVLEESRKA